MDKIYRREIKYNKIRVYNEKDNVMKLNMKKNYLTIMTNNTT